MPLVWSLEVVNALLAAIRRRRIKEAEAFRFLALLDTLPLEIDLEVTRGALGQRVLGLGLTHGLSAYNASYLELAMRRGLPLATQDERLLQAAGAAGIEFLQP